MAHIEETYRQILIATKLRKEKATLKEIQRYLEQKSELDNRNYNVSDRTFDRDKKDIEAIFGISIKYDSSEKAYYINNDSHPAFNDQLFEAYEVFNVLKFAEKNSDHILLEKRRAAGTEHLNDLLHAIKKELKVSFTYQKYYTDAPEQKVVKPLALKVYRYRWYLIAIDRDDRRYGLDRISNLKILSDHFAPHNVDINEIQKHSFGVEVAKDYTPQKIVLSFTPEAGKYAKSLPWHDSQEILIDNDKELRISLYVYPTEDLKMEILSQSKNIKVIEPQSLVDEMKEIYRGALGRYD